MKNAIFWDVKTKLVPRREQMWRRVALVETDVSEECIVSNIMAP
jgi:hypothetical protein